MEFTALHPPVWLCRLGRAGGFSLTWDLGEPALSKPVCVLRVTSGTSAVLGAGERTHVTQAPLLPSCGCSPPL